jgi:hypothetical protein
VPARCIICRQRPNKLHRSLNPTAPLVSPAKHSGATSTQPFIDLPLRLNWLTAGQFLLERWNNRPGPPA